MYTSIISAQELSKLLGKKNVAIIDCRFSLADINAGREEYVLSHIPGAHYAHLDDDLSGEITAGKTGRHPFPEIDEFANKCGSWGIDENTQVIAYDHSHGGIAARLWFLLKWLGHENVAVLNGGWKNWTENGFPTSPTLPTPAIKEFIPNPNNERLIPVEKMESLMSDKDFLIVDSRAADRYRGEVEPIDPVAGHIPGAVSAPFSDNLAEDGLFKSKNELEARFKNIIQNKPAEQTIFYCGSGVTACHNLLALSHIGIDSVKLFPGSWSEWITDASRPVASGND